MELNLQDFIRKTNIQDILLKEHWKITNCGNSVLRLIDMYSTLKFLHKNLVVQNDSEFESESESGFISRAPQSSSSLKPLHSDRHKSATAAASKSSATGQSATDRAPMRRALTRRAPTHRATPYGSTRILRSASVHQQQRQQQPSIRQCHTGNRSSKCIHRWELWFGHAERSK